MTKTIKASFAASTVGTINYVQLVADAGKAAIIDVKGRDKAKRNAAFLQIAPYAFSASRGKAALVNALDVALGKTPTDAEVACASQETTVGIATDKMPLAEFPAGITSDSDRMEYVRLLITSFSPAPKEGAEMGKLPKGKLGRRTPVQQRVIANAQNLASKYLAETGHGTAMTEAEAQKRKAAKAKGASPPDGSKGDAPSHSELVTPAASMTAADYIQHMTTQLASLCHVDKKAAKVRPIECEEFAAALLAIKQLINKAANDYGLRMAASAPSE